jgi:hypothetical protein
MWSQLIWSVDPRVPNKPQQLLPAIINSKTSILIAKWTPTRFCKTWRCQQNSETAIHPWCHEPHTYPNQKQKDHKSRWHNKAVSPATTGISLSQETRGQLLTTRHQQDPRKKTNVIGWTHRQVKHSRISFAAWNETTERVLGLVNWTPAKSP